MLISHSRPGRKSNEEVFFGYYRRLLEWATQITQGNREEAEDLVHDLYLRVSRIARPIDQIESPEPYLFRILRNLHYSQLRRAGRDPINDLSIVDYDSVELGLAAADRRQLLFVRANLRQICRYACERKSTARSAGVLILRFFHGYYPSELMRILQSPRSSIDRALHVARNEARLNLERPGAIRCISPWVTQPVTFPAEGEGTQKLFIDLQNAIFDAVEGECFEREILDQRYAVGGEAPSMTALELSHLVSCKTCLDEVNTILGLPLLKDRSPEYGLDRDGTSGPGAGPGDAGGMNPPTGTRTPTQKGPSIRKLERRAREMFEHRPDKLQVAVDGEVRTSQKVSAETNELHLKLAHKEEPSFIEVFSEQGLCLAYLQVEEPTSSDQLEQVETVLLSDNRSLTVTLTFAADVPIIHVLYVDPVAAEDAATDFDEGTSATFLHRTTGNLTVPPFGQIVRRPKKWLGRWMESLWTWVQSRCEAFLSFMNPMLVTAMVCAVATVVFLALSFRASLVMKPEELLRRAARSENAPVLSGTTGVIVQGVRIQTPQRKLERTIYRDIQDRRRPKSRDLSREDAAVQSQLEALGISWDDPLSAHSFRDWHSRAAVRRDVVKRTGAGLLTLTTSVEAETVVSESLTLREADFHPVERTIELRDTGTIEIAELNYSVLPWSSVNPDLFEPLAGGRSVFGGDARPSLRVRLPAPLTAIQIDEAELSARLVLNRLNLDASAGIELSRAADGIHVRGVVDNDAIKHQLQSQLYLVPHVFPSILTAQEMASKPNVSPEVTSIVQTSVAAAAPSALERYFTERGMDRATVAASAQQLVDSSFAVKHDSEQIAGLLERFSSDADLSADARTVLSELLIKHKAKLLDALGSEERQLVTLQLISRPAGLPEDSQGNASDLRVIADHNFSTCVELISATDPSSSPPQAIASQLAASIVQLRVIALHISAAAQLSPPPGAVAPDNQKK